MTDFTLNQTVDQSGPIQPASRPNLDKGFNPLTMIAFFGILAAGLLFVALLIALGFEFVNGFHDTANAVAAVI